MFYRGTYGFRRQDIAERLHRFLSVKGIECRDKASLILAFRITAERMWILRMHTYLLIRNIGPEKVMTFNVKDFRKVDAEVFSPEEVLRSLKE